MQYTNSVKRDTKQEEDETMKMWKVYFTNWEYSVADGLVEAEFATEEEAWAWVEAHDNDLSCEEAYEVAYA